MEVNQIENKEDSPEKLAAVDGRPTKYFLFATELMAIVNWIKKKFNILNVSNDVSYPNIDTLLFDPKDFFCGPNQATPINQITVRNKSILISVSTLPTENIEANKIYVLPDGSWNWRNGNSWVSNGSGNVDLSGKEDVSNKSNSDADIDSTIKFPTWNAIWTKALSFFQETLVSGTNIKTLNGESLLGSGNIVIGGSSTNKQIFHWFGGNWSTGVLDRYYYIGFNGGAIEGTTTTINGSMNGRNKGLFAAPFDCKIKRVIFKEGGSGSYTGAFVLASGLPNYDGTWNVSYGNIVTHLNEVITAAGYEQKKNEYLVTDDITVPKGYVVCPMLVFSAQAQAGKTGIDISVEIEEIV